MCESYIFYIDLIPMYNNKISIFSNCGKITYNQHVSIWYFCLIWSCLFYWVCFAFRYFLFDRNYLYVNSSLTEWRKIQEGHWVSPDWVLFSSIYILCPFNLLPNICRCISSNKNKYYQCFANNNKKRRQILIMYIRSK